MTCNEMLASLIADFTNGGIIEARADALLLFDYIAGINRSELFIHGDRELDSDTRERLLAAKDKRLQHIPLQQITGFQSFMGLEFAVDENVLIPRQDTEVLVEEVLKEASSGLRILDVCTGSGCILLSLLKYMNDCEGLGIDISEAALRMASANSDRLNIPAEFRQGDLFDAISEDDGKYDIIVSNPPYIKSEAIEGLMEEVRDHEPRLALDGGEDGLIFYRRIISESPRFLPIGGKLFLEIGYDEGDEVSALMREAGFVDVRVVKDLAGLDRVVRGEYSIR